MPLWHFNGWERASKSLINQGPQGVHGLVLKVSIDNGAVVKHLNNLTFLNKMDVELFSADGYLIGMDGV
jgi:hypothetical protein